MYIVSYLAQRILCAVIVGIEKLEISSASHLSPKFSINRINGNVLPNSVNIAVGNGSLHMLNIVFLLFQPKRLTKWNPCVMEPRVMFKPLHLTSLSRLKGPHIKA